MDKEKQEERIGQIVQGMRLLKLSDFRKKLLKLSEQELSIIEKIVLDKNQKV